VLTAHAMPGRRRIEWKSAGTLLSTGDRDELRFERRRGMLRNILTPAVPALAAKHVDEVLAKGLEREQVSRDEISAWILHAGGREILSAIRQRVGLSEDQTRWSAAILRDYGNVSSPCVYFVLQAALNERAAGGYWWMSSFGAGFTCHGVLLAVE
jgi:alkylresorcinol/alkylpyrone synthase